MTTPTHSHPGPSISPASNIERGNRSVARIGLAGLVLATLLHLPTAIHAQAQQAPAEVDLSGEETELPAGEEQEHVLARPWYQNLDISGFGGFAFLDSGESGTRPNGGFLMKEATLMVEADVWERTSIFVEVQTNRLGDDKTKFIRTAEVYGHFRNLISGDDHDLGIKLGRIDIPFGEEYLWQDAPDNPLISNSASYPYGWDEGVLVYGRVSGVNWIVAVTDGTDERSVEDNPSKAVNLKVHGNVAAPLYVSASFMRNGMAAKSAMEFGGSHFRPVGAAHESSLGASASEQVHARLFELNGKYSLGELGRQGYVSATFGGATQTDEDPEFDRDLRWLTLEGLAQLPRSVYAVARYSEIGTYESDQGFHFDGKPTAGGNGAFGYDVKRLRRISAGLGFDPNPRVRVKLEVGHDRYYLIDAAPMDPADDDRLLFGFGVALRY